MVDSSGDGMAATMGSVLAEKKAERSVLKLVGLTDILLGPLSVDSMDV